MLEAHNVKHLHGILAEPHEFHFDTFHIYQFCFYNTGCLHYWLDVFEQRPLSANTTFAASVYSSYVHLLKIGVYSHHISTKNRYNFNSLKKHHKGSNFEVFH